MGPRRDNKSEGVAFGIEMEEDGRGRELGLEENGVCGKDDEEDVTENERKSANPKTEECLIGIHPVKEHHLIHTI